MREYKVGPGEDIQLGHRWEHHARRIVFDISEWVKDFGAGTVQLLNQRQDDASPYPVAITRTDPDKVTVNDTTGTLVFWDVTAVDTNCQSSRAELLYYRGTEVSPDFLVKSDIHKVNVDKALGAPYSTPPTETPEWPVEPESITRRLSQLESGKVDKVPDKGLSTNDYTDTDKNAVATIGNKVDKVSGKSLSTNDYTDADKNAVAAIGNKVDKVSGKSLSTNDYTDADKNAVAAIGNKVDKVPGKSLSTNDYTDADKNAVAAIGNKVDKVSGKSLSTNDYTDADKNAVAAIGNKVDKVTGKSLSTNDYTDADKNAVAAIGNKVDKVPGKSLSTNDYTDADKNAVAAIGNKVDKVSGKGLSTNDYTDADKNAVAAIGNKVDKVTGKSLSTNDYTDADKNAVAAIGNKVDKVTGKGLSTNDYTDADKNKLAGIAAEANKTIIDATLSNTGQAADAKTTGDSLSALQSLISRMEIYCEASGNPATFDDADAANVKALSVTLTPTQSGSGAPSPSNVRPISGVSSVTVTRTGKNLFNILSVESNSYITQNSNGTLTVRNTSASEYGVASPSTSPLKHYAPSLTAGKTYTLSATSTANVKYIYLKGSRSTWTFGTAKRLTQADLDDIMYFYASATTAGVTATVSSFQIEEGNTASDYEPANEETVSVTLTDGSNPLTVYSGTLNVTTGALTVTHKLVTLNSSINFVKSSSQLLKEGRSGYYIAYPGFADCVNSRNDLNAGGVVMLYSHAPSGLNALQAAASEDFAIGVGNVGNANVQYAMCWINISSEIASSVSEFRAWLDAQQTAGTPVQVLYPLAAPLTYQLTPQQLATLRGYNAVYSVAGSVSVTYKANASLAYEGLTHLILSLGGNVS